MTQNNEHQSSKHLSVRRSITIFRKRLQHQILWYLYRIGPRHAELNGPHIGWSAVLGFLLIVATLGGYFVLVRPLEQRLADMRQTVQSLNVLKTRPAQVAQPELRVSSPSDQLAVFYQSFPERNSIHDALGRAHRLAAENQVNLQQGDYRLVKVRDSQLMRYEVTLPIKGDYLRIRAFLAAVLMEMHNVSLDTVKFSRPKVGESEVETQVSLSIYVRDP